MAAVAAFTMTTPSDAAVAVFLEMIGGECFKRLSDVIKSTNRYDEVSGRWIQILIGIETSIKVELLD
jgi:hypothetical protein